MSQTEQQKQLIEKFTANMNAYEQKVFPDLLLEHELSPAKFKHICISELKKNPDLQKAFVDNPMSLFASILFFAEIGLSPDGGLGEAYLIPYRSGNGGKYEIKPIVGYHGIIKVLLRSNAVKFVETNCVFEGDTFEYELGLKPLLRHIPNHEVERSSKTFKYAYAVAELDNGKTIFRVMSKSEIEKVRDMAKFTNKLFFDDKKDPNFWMPQKTILKQLSKLLPKDFYGSKAIQYDNMVEGGASLVLDGSNNIKVIEGAVVKPQRYRNIYGTLSDSEVETELETKEENS